MLIQAGPEHAAVLAALHATSFAAPWTAQEFETLLRQPGVAAWIWNDSAPQGFILVRAAADEAEILTLAVVPEHRRKGAAFQLLAHALDVLRSGGTARMFLEVAADNTAASALYMRHGFAPCGRRADYYGAGGKTPPVDAVVMKRELVEKT
jgi:ribosomal-protein-alanine N-acetyltransferase